MGLLGEEGIKAGQTLDFYERRRGSTLTMFF